MKLRGRLAFSSLTAGGDNGHYSLLLCTHLPDGTPDLSGFELLKNLPPFMEVREGSILKLPYDLLIPWEEAKEDFENYRLGRPKKAADGSWPTIDVCNAHIELAKRGHLATPERRLYWINELANHANRWVEMEVDLQRYSFPVKGSKGNQRVGTRLILRTMVPLELKE